MRKIWGLHYSEIYADDFLIWRPEIRNPFYEGNGYKIGMNRKFLLEALKSGVDRFIIKVGQREISMNVPPEKELKRKDRAKEFEDRPSLFENSPAMRIYYFKL